MECVECDYAETQCELCRADVIAEVARRAEARKKTKHGYAELGGKSPSCKCCTKYQMALFYAHCPKDMYIGQLVPAPKGGKFCVKNLKYFPILP